MYYKHSGRFTLGGLLIAAIVGSSASLVLAYIYAHGIIYIPEVHLAVFATLAYGGLVGVAAGYGLVWGKIRNYHVGLTLAGIIATLSLYMSWAIWVSSTLESQKVQNVNSMALAQHPGALWNVICLVNQYGTWGLNSGSATNGWALWIVWFLEAVFVIGLAIFAGSGILGLHCFCETCGYWCTRGAKLMLAAPQDVGQLKLQLEANDLHTLENLGPGNKSANHLDVSLDSCQHCRQFHTMNLMHTTIAYSKKGKQTVHSKTIVQHLLIGPGHADTLRQLSEKMARVTNATPKVKVAVSGK